jgi:hypothetical protein
MIDLNILSIIGTNVIVLWWLTKPIRGSLVSLEKQVLEIRKDVKQNSERIARIEGVIWADIKKAKQKQ